VSNVNPSQLTAWAGSIDIANDLVMVWKAANSTLYKATPNQLANLASQWVGVSDTQTLTNKTITAPAISSPVLSGTVTGTYTIGGTPTFPSSVVTLTGSQTLTNKILTSPTINAPTITNATITADAVSGFSSASTGTIYGLSIASGKLGSNTVVTGSITDGAVTAPKLDTGAITLGYAQITTNFTTGSTTAVQATGLTVTVTIPAGGRKIKITAWSGQLYNQTASRFVNMEIWDGTVGSGTRLALVQNFTGATANAGSSAVAVAVVTPSAGSKTYNVGCYTDALGGTAGIQAVSTAPAFILVEAI
jgi:hypothetical protein